MRETFEMTIEKMVAGGLGFGHLADGMVVMVSHVLPGEFVQIKPVARRKSYLDAQLVKVLKPALGRIVPSCQAYGRCGGCDLQHVNYGLQLELKQQILIELLRRSLILPLEQLSDVLLPPLGAAEPFGYRQRIRLQIESDTYKKGFYQAGTHKLEPIRSCLLARPELNLALQDIEELAEQALFKFADAIELLLNTDELSVVVLILCSRRPRPADLVRAKTLIKVSSIIKEVLFAVAAQGMFFSTGERADTAEVSDLLSFTLATEELLGRTIRFNFEPGGFCQVNKSQNEQLVSLLLEWAQIDQNQQVLDLYCGMGNFSLPLACRAKAVTGFDLKRSAIRSASRNALNAGLTNCRFAAKDALVAARDLVQGSERFDLVLLDPPRQGCAEIIPYLADLANRAIIYISCDPATLCRDLKMLIKSGFMLDRIQIVDMFPQTHHLEVIARLHKRKDKDSD